MRTQPQNLDVTLSLFVVPADLPRPETFCAIADKFGFHTLTSFDLESITRTDRSRLMSLRAPSSQNQRWKVVVTADFAPRPLDWKGGDAHWGQTVDNGRLTDVWKLWACFRDLVSKSTHAYPGNEALLFTPTSQVARDMLARWRPDITNEVEEVLSKGVRSMTPPIRVIRELEPSAWARDARTFLAQHRGRPAVLKVFRPGRERFVKNHLVVSERLGQMEEIPRVLDWGPNWVLITFVDDAVSLKGLVKEGALLPMRLVRRLSSLVRAIHDRRIAFLDFNPRNVLVDSRGEVHLVDYDHIYEYTGALPSVEHNLMLTGYPSLLALDGPAKLWSYDNAWRKMTGLPADVFLHPSGYRVPAWRLHARSRAARRRFKRVVRRTSSLLFVAGNKPAAPGAQPEMPRTRDTPRGSLPPGRSK